MYHECVVSIVNLLRLLPINTLSSERSKIITMITITINPLKINASCCRLTEQAEHRNDDLRQLQRWRLLVSWARHVGRTTGGGPRVPLVGATTRCCCCHRCFILVVPRI